MSDPRIGMTVCDRFRINSRVGEGGMGAVYLADDPATGKRVAVKFLHRHLTLNEEFVARFRQEAKAAGSFHHQNAVRILDTGEDTAGIPWIAMEYCGGRSLKAVIRDEAPLSSRRSCDLARQILSALGAAHRSGIVHRDLKPENVKVESSREGEVVKILDFGVAKFIGTEDMKEMSGAVKTKTGIVFGTPKYMSPEQILGEKVDGRSDIYSVGAILYEMLTGTPPFASDDIIGFITKHLKEPVEPPTERDPDLVLPAGLEETLLGMLKKDRQARPARAEDVAEALERYTAHGGAGASASGEHPFRLLVFLAGAALGATLGSLLAPDQRPACIAAACGLGVGALLAFKVWPRVGEVAFWLRTTLVALLVASAGAAAHYVAGGDPFVVASLSVGVILVFVGFALGWGRRSRRLAFAGALAMTLLAGLLLPLPVEQRQGDQVTRTYIPTWQAAQDDPTVAAPSLALVAIAVSFTILGLFGPKAATATRR